LRKAPAAFSFGGPTFEIPGVEPRLTVVIPKDFEDFLPLFKNVGISVFVWEGDGEWKCRDCEKLTVIAAPWKPKICATCNKKKPSFSLVGLTNFKLSEVYRAPK
jgi:hypothetical protein